MPSYALERPRNCLDDAIMSLQVLVRTRSSSAGAGDDAIMQSEVLRRKKSTPAGVDDDEDAIMPFKCLAGHGSLTQVQVMMRSGVVKCWGGHEALAKV